VLISEVLKGKDPDVVTVPPELTVSDLLAVLAEHRIGAAVVSRDGRAVEGIVSERDVVRALAARGAGALNETVSQICTQQVHTTTRGARTEELMVVMTDKRFRHVPVVEDGSLLGIVSIGDVVKHRTAELEAESAALNAYISTGG
jgi:CBS domain-containing protein